MFIDDLRRAVDAADDLATIHQLERMIWRQAWPQYLGDAEAHELTELLHAKRKARLAGKGERPPAGFTTPKVARAGSRPKSPESIARRRRLAAQCPMPSEQAQHFTQAEQAVARVIADDMKRNGVSTMPNGKTAALAGCCVTVVKNCKRKLRARRMASTETRPQRGQRSLTTVVRFSCPVWRRWVVRHKGGGISASTTDQRFKKDRERAAVDRPQSGLSMTKIANSMPRAGP